MDTEAIPIPKGRGSDARDYLDAHGITAVEPCIRSSDYELARSCELAYYLRRRLGIIPALQYGEALARGSWFHKRLEYFELLPHEAMVNMQANLKVRQLELKHIAEQRGIGPEELSKLQSREERDMMSACGWYEAMWKYRAEGLGPLGAYLTKPYWRCLGSEVLLVLKTTDVPLVAAIDLLLYHTQQNVLWIVDFKTCSEPTDVRLATCPIEFQTQHYMHVTDRLLEDMVLQDYWGLPSQAKLAGMMHIAIQKPTISFNQMDRDCEEYEHEISRGERKGTIEIRRKYSGEPKFENYLDRCQRWYNAEGEYEDKRQDRIDCPPVNISRTPASLCLDGPAHESYLGKLNYVKSLACRTPVPCNFLESASYLRSFGRLHPLSPFYLCPIHQWPDMMAQDGFVVQHRDKDVDREKPVGTVHA